MTTSAIIIYFRLSGRLRHWTLSYPPEADIIESGLDPDTTARCWLQKSFPHASFVEARTDDITPKLSDDIDACERLIAGWGLLAAAVQITTIQGHLLRRSYPHEQYEQGNDQWTAAAHTVEAAESTAGTCPGGEIIGREFNSAIEAYAACCEAVKKEGGVINS